MACTDCNQSYSNFQYPSGLYNSTSYCDNYTDTKCITYTGPALTCLNIQPNTCLQDIIQSLDTKVCQIIGDYTQYNFNCLSSIYTITNEAEFVDSITEYACSIRTDLNNFILTTNNGIVNIQNQIDDITSPGLTSPCVSNIIYDANSTLDQIITAQSTAICNLFTQLSLAGVNWSQCYTPASTPTTVVEGFNEVINQICLTRAAITSSGALPVFDNTGTCLSSPTVSDSLVDTVVKIRTRLCNTPTFNAANLLASSCVQFSGSSTLENVINAQNNQIDQISSTSIRAASAQFIITDIDPLQPCLGKTISLASSVVDRNVAATVSDVTPGTLQDKLQAGTNVTLDYVTTPGKVIINSTGGVTTDEKVKVSASDTTAGYLDTKIIGDTSDPIIQTLVTPGTSSVQVSTTLDMTNLIDAIFDAIETDPVLKARFCAIVNSCPVVCTPPSNVSVTFQ